MIQLGYRADIEIFEALVTAANNGNKRSLSKHAHSIAPMGSRMVVFRDPQVTEYTGEDGTSSIIIPDTVSTSEPPASGYVFAVGNTVGQGSSPHPHGVYCEHPTDLLYQHIVFGRYSTKELRLDFLESGWDTTFWVMTDRDVWSIDTTCIEAAEKASQEASSKNRMEW